uniref:Ig-like domain-containing protein n=1 Tax=Cyprinodon variegatus TaxID=28743 RepID=A0A3Q2EAP1_CYPVA
CWMEVQMYLLYFFFLLEIVSNKVVVTQKPNSSQMFSGETITLTCEVQGGESTEWTYEWRRSGSVIHSTPSKDWTFNVYESSSGKYTCQCRRKQSSETAELTVYSGIRSGAALDNTGL